jgi:hypothetical protein
LCGCVILAAIALHGFAEPPSFVIHPAPARDGMTVNYFLTGAFGGYGGQASRSDNGEFSVPLLVEDKPAKSLKAIAYAPGCDFQLFFADLASTESRSEAFRCDALPTAALHGKLLSVPAGYEAPEVLVSYQACWASGFFGYADGPVQTFDLGAAPLDSTGRFQFDVPLFSKSRIASLIKDAGLRLYLRDRRTGNRSELFAPAAQMPQAACGLQLMSQYPGEVAFNSR